MKPTNPSAIARRDREWFADVLCSNCRAVIAHRQRCSQDDESGEPQYYLYFDAGILPNPSRTPGEDGIWKLTRHARYRKEHGHEPAVRRQRRRSFGFGRDERRDLGTMLVPDRGPRATKNRFTAEQVPPSLPTSVECPKCRSVQYLDPEVLEVVSADPLNR